jgi:ribosome-binding factor A
LANEIRRKKLGSLIQREIASLIIREIKDPRLDGVSITDVLLSDDMSEAKVFFFVHRDMDVRGVLKAFHSAKGFLRAELSHLIEIRRIPDLTFIYDDSLDFFERINKTVQERNDT